jgi:hypothetical protein
MRDKCVSYVDSAQILLWRQGAYLLLDGHG